MIKVVTQFEYDLEFRNLHWIIFGCNVLSPIKEMIC